MSRFKTSLCSGLFAVALGACGGGHDVDSTAAPGSAITARSARPVLSGRVERWPEATRHLNVTLEGDRASVTLGEATASGLTAFWSIASTAGDGSGFFYSDAIQGRSETRVAHAAGIRRVQEITDASAFDYSRSTVGPVEPHGIVLVHHVPTDRYLAIAIDALVPLDPRTAGAGPYAYADVTWYLTEPGSASFSAAP